MRENPIPTAHFDALVKSEIEPLGAILAGSGKSITIIVVAASGEVVETFGHSVVKPSERELIVAGLKRETERLAEQWS